MLERQIGGQKHRVCARASTDPSRFVRKLMTAMLCRMMGWESFQASMRWVYEEAAALAFLMTGYALSLLPARVLHTSIPSYVRGRIALKKVAAG